MNNFSIPDATYVYPTPMGAYYATLSAADEAPRRFMRRLLSASETPRMTESLAQEWTGEGLETALDLVHRLYQMEFIQGLSTPKSAPEGNLEKNLPTLLSTLSDLGKVVLVEDSGFYIGSTGFPHETAEELAGLAADLAIINDRHTGLLQNNLRFDGSWALVNSAGSSEVGFWPLHFGRLSFIVVIAGIPMFNQPQFTQLAWLLGRRYGEMID